ncbi:hypothetical protein KUTeg_019535 [Tegillarca granosa]|uniref:SUMO-activating enzyme subunit n=1 Tax=Tegillarca granosa TaxID=220873 RepID=A0ABQ9ECT4_TEGGR|nr:hypothetical protein KUTeg_019535 [Tegillarca granosa]
MAASLNEKVRKTVNESKILVVGAGGIGCELLKNLVLTGFTDIEVIDLDTIDVSNLNRQFLFRKEHVGKSKAQVAKESAQKFNPDAKIISYHDSIMSPDYGVDFFQKFKVVMNALDNRAARNHVNRMCLAADIPLIESGTAENRTEETDLPVIKTSSFTLSMHDISSLIQGLTECYECQPKPTQKTFPGCTIRNTPSEPIHCIVWAKHLFNQLFGEEDPDQDVSPDTEDPELAGEAGQSALQTDAKDDAVVFTVNGNSMEKETTAYTSRPRSFTYLSASESAGIRDQKLWTIQECADVFSNCLPKLKAELSQQGEGGMLVWDKDDESAMDFVTAVANIRAYIFGIQTKTRFDIKSMAGNIIPAIATTNAIIAGLLVMEGLKILTGNIDKCRTVYLNRQPNPRKKLLVPCILDKPNPKCYVCSAKPEVTVILNTQKITVKVLEEKIIKGQLNMVAPDVEIDDGKENADKFLSDFGIKNGSRLKCDDFLQNYELNITIVHKRYTFSMK